MKTWLTEALGIKHPIVQGAMGSISDDPEFVAAVANAGGLGMLATGDLSGEGTREAIWKIRELTDKPFGVNLLPTCRQHDQVLAVMREERVPVFNHGKGNAQQCIEVARSVGALAIPTVGAVKHAVKCEEAGCDAVIVTGAEAGGHTGYVGTMVLVPAVIRAVKIPVIAGGGIAVPEQMAAALTLGAQGIEMGTRFLVTKEARVHPNYKQYYIDHSEEDTIPTHVLSGRRSRLLATKFVKWIVENNVDQKVDKDLIRTKWQAYRTPPMYWGRVDEGMAAGGQCIGLIHDCPTIAELIKRMVDGAESVLRDLAQRFARPGVSTPG